MNRIPALLVALLFLAPAYAQDKEEPGKPAATPKAKEAKTPEELAASQREVGKRLQKIEETMQRVAKILEKRNPEQAALLRMAIQQSKADANMEKVREIEVFLRENQLSDAIDNQKVLDIALRRLVDILLDRDAERKDLQRKIKEHEDDLKTLKGIIERERNHFHESEKYADPEKTLQRAAAAKAKLEDLIARQQKVIDKTKNPGENADVAAMRKELEAIEKEQKALRGQKNGAAQEALGKRAEALAQKIAEHAKQMPDAMKKDKLGRSNPADQAAAATQRAAGAMKDGAARMQGGGQFKPNQENAEQELREAKEALQRLADRHKAHDQDRLAKDQKRLEKDAERLQKDLERLERAAPGEDSGSSNVGKAQGQMDKAGKSLSKGNREQALPKEQKAKDELEKAKSKLEEMEKALKRLIKLPDYEKMAKDQEDTTKKTEDLLKKMKGAQKPQPGDEGQQGEPSAGQQNTEEAKKAMQRAQRNLRGKSAKSANKEQKEALDRLKKAQEELEEALRQLREEEQLMLLEALERRFARMLQKQTRVFKETLALNTRLRDAKGKKPRALVDKGKQLGLGEAELAAEADKVLEILKEEGSTIVIPDVVEDMKTDLDMLSTRLAGLKTGE
ncbi:MAG: hypothetical protein OER88_04995, partial [Planctomycetota bacterium]|nr:hypothetical protein [Planctomycetota bacterium]